MVKQRYCRDANTYYAPPTKPEGPRRFPTYYRFLQFTLNTSVSTGYYMSLKLLQLTTDCYRLLQAYTGYYMSLKLLQLTTGCYRLLKLLQVTTGYYRLLQV